SAARHRVAIRRHWRRPAPARRRRDPPAACRGRTARAAARCSCRRTPEWEWEPWAGARGGNLASRMATMPLRSRSGQPDAAQAWFASSEGAALLQSENDAIAGALAERPAQHWLWLAPLPPERPEGGRGLALYPRGARFAGDVSCGVPLPLPSEAIGTVVVQHAATPGEAGAALLEEVARVLQPGGQVLLFGLNPLSPYRWRWRGQGLHAAEPLSWRRLLRRAGLEPRDVSRGLGPRWEPVAGPGGQSGAGLRAAYPVRAEKRSLPLTPVRQRRLLPAAAGAAGA